MAASSPSRKRALDEDGDAATGAAPSAKRVPTVNPLNGRPFSSTYHELREQRMKLPVSGFLDDLEKRLRTSQVVIVEGETGSGKTTQVSELLSLPTWLPLGPAWRASALARQRAASTFMFALHAFRVLGSVRWWARGRASRPCP